MILYILPKLPSTEAGNFLNWLYKYAINKCYWALIFQQVLPSVGSREIVEYSALIPGVVRLIHKGNEMQGRLSHAPGFLWQFGADNISPEWRELVFLLRLTHWSSHHFAEGIFTNHSWGPSRLRALFILERSQHPHLGEKAEWVRRLPKRISAFEKTWTRIGSVLKTPGEIVSIIPSGEKRQPKLREVN